MKTIFEIVSWYYYIIVIFINITLIFIEDSSFIETLGPKLILISFIIKRPLFIEVILDKVRSFGPSLELIII
jgi:hypothetical protein